MKQQGINLKNTQTTLRAALRLCQLQLGRSALLWLDLEWHVEPAAPGLSPEAARGTCETHRWPDGLTSLCACVLSWPWPAWGGPSLHLCGELYVCELLASSAESGPRTKSLTKCAPELPTVASRHEQVNWMSFILEHND